MSDPFVSRGLSRRLAPILVPLLFVVSVSRLSAADGTTGFALFDRSAAESVEPRQASVADPEVGAATGPVTASPDDPASPVSPLDPAEGRSLGPRRRLASDATALVTSPLRMDRHDVFRLSLALAVVAATHAADDELRDLARGSGGAGGERFARAIRPLGQEAGWALLGAAYLSGRASGREKWVSVARDGFEASLFSAGFVAPLIKASVGRSRPRTDLGSEDFEVRGESFVSGEVTQAFAMASVIAAHSDNRWVDAAAWGSAGLVGWERMRLDAHWASDVVAAAILGTAIGRWVVHRNLARDGEPRRWTLRPASARSASGGSEGLGLGIDLSFD